MSQQTIPKDELSKTEWLVMQAIWSASDKEASVTVSELLPRVRRRRDWHVSTLKTTMERLVEKGYLSSRLRGNTCFYRATVSREQMTRKSVSAFVDEMLEGAFGPLVAYLANRKNLSQDDIAALEKLLAGHQGEKRK